MGQIIIELPNHINRHYQVTNQEFANFLIELLQTSAAPVKKNPAKLNNEDKADIRAARRARKGDLVAWEDVKEQLGLK